MAAAEVINHAPLILPQPRDAPRLPTSHPSPSPSQSTKRNKKKDKQREKEKPTLESHRGETSGQKSGGFKKLENTSSRQWNWTSLTDATVSSHPPVFTRDGRSVAVIVCASIPSLRFSTATSSLSLVLRSRFARRRPVKSYRHYLDHTTRGTPTSLLPLFSVHKIPSN